MDPILLCTDLDRTLLPNGLQPESPGARELFSKLAAAPFVSLAYVSGRNLKLLAEAISSYNLPTPDFMIGDVGTTIYSNNNNGWEAVGEWQQLIAEDWQDVTAADLEAMLADIKELTLQEPEKQGPFKLSYFTPPDIDPEKLVAKVSRRLANCPARVSLIHSIDEVNNLGLFDLLPEGATKLHAVRFLIEKSGVLPTRTIYAGDSGNDMEVFRSEIKSILVANTAPEVQRMAMATSPTESTHLARGGFLGMNGNYAAGILEGLTHYLPETIPLFAQIAEKD
ncbi:MAG: HAD-IIB family hydrolase [Thermodesulfobacteriota bacterium]